MSVLEILRGYTLREYAVVLAMAVLGGLGLVFMLSSMGGGAASGETLAEARDRRPDEAPLRCASWKSNAAARARAKAAAARRARILAERRASLRSALRAAQASWPRAARRDPLAP